MNEASASSAKEITVLIIGCEADLVNVRQQVRAIAEFAGFEKQDQIRIATALSELVRNVIQYAGTGKVFVGAEITSFYTGLLFRIQDSGPGIAHIDLVLSGRYVSQTGMGRGLLGTKLLMDSFRIETVPGGGTTVEIGKHLPRRAEALTLEKVEVIRNRLKGLTAEDPVQELQRQNQEQLQTLNELRERQVELVSLNQELEATNRGVLALYAELDERATFLRKVSDSKSRFLSNMSHEFRTPLNSIRTLTSMLLEHMDGPLLPEQEKQINYISHAAKELAELVDDLLDLAKAEAGRLTIRTTKFDVDSVFNILRGLLKPLTKDSAVTLNFEEPKESIVIVSDEGKVSQILRNFISNAIKFTPEGTVNVRAERTVDSVLFSVSDTGFGISNDNLERVFEEFSQIENPAQSSVKGTGLGLPLSRKLAESLGGKVWAESALDQGSVFFLSLPSAGDGNAEDYGTSENGLAKRVLVIDDDEISRYVLQSQLERLGHVVVHAVNGEEGLERAKSGADVIFLDLNMPGIDGYEVLRNLKFDSATRSIPVVVNTSTDLTPDEITSLLENGAQRVIFKGENYGRNAVSALEDIL